MYERKGENLIIICRGYGYEDAPYPKPDNTDLWTLNMHIYERQDCDLLWCMHMFEHYGTHELDPVKFANALNIPIMMPKAYDELPLTIEFPLEEIINKYGSDYFMTAMTYMFAYAMYLGYKKIDCYGMNMRGYGEVYKNGKACAEYWIGRLQQAGIEINVHGKYNTLLKTYDRRLYGYGDLFQQFPEDINDIPLYSTLVTGLDIEGLDNIHGFLSNQKNSKYTKNLHLFPYSEQRYFTEHNIKTVLDSLERSDSKFVGDVSFTYMPNLDYVRTVSHAAKILCISDFDEELLKHYDGYEKVFPKNLGECYNDLFKEMKTQAERYPFNARIFPKEVLKTKEGQSEILSFIGYKPEEMTLGGI